MAHAQRKINLPDSVEKVGKGAFSGAGCTINIPSKVKYIGDSAFSQVILDEFQLPDTLAEIGANAFYYARYIKSEKTAVKIPNHVITIGSNAFYSPDDWLNIKSFYLTSSVTSIGAQAFSHGLTNADEAPVLYVPAGSYAEQYCKNNHYNYRLWAEETEMHEHQIVQMPYKASGCTEAGNIEHWKCTVCGMRFSNEEMNELAGETEIAPTGHHYRKPEFVWTEDGRKCTVNFICIAEDDVQSFTVDSVGEQVHEPSCIQPGQTCYTVSVSFEGTVEFEENEEETTVFVGQRTLEDIPAKGHTKVVIAGIPADCVREGTTDKIYCGNVEKY